MSTMCPACDAPLTAANGVCPRCGEANPANAVANAATEVVDLNGSGSGSRAGVSNALTGSTSASGRYGTGSSSSGRHATSASGRRSASRADVPTPLMQGDTLIGQRIAGCEIISVLGHGGMGRVYRGVHEGLGKDVAVKVLNASLVMNSTFVERFLREARAAAQLDHPNVVRILNAGEEAGRHFIVMEMVSGENLRVRLARDSRLDRPEAMRIVTGVAHALAAAHELGLVHRDIKPDNIMVDEYGAVKVADFGLARSVAGGGDITGEGVACGTPPYMSPEQISGLAVDGRSDLYSLGIVLYECLSGRRPFTAHDLLGWLACHTQLEPEPLRRHVHELPEGVEGLVTKLLAKRPEERYADARELLTDLQFLGGDEVTVTKDTTRRSSRADLQPTGIRRLHQLLSLGVDDGAVSLHLEPMPAGGRVRMRVRTGLKEIERLSPGSFRQLIDACKSAAGQATAGVEGPVEGVVEFDHDRQHRQAKLTLAPTLQGPRAALRLMGLVKPHRQLIQHGFSATDVRLWRNWLTDGAGVTVVAGPAGSGKGQTLGGLLGLVDLGSMVTVAVAEETHVESEDIAQIQVDHRTPRQDALRLALRQYPDLLLMLDVDGLGDRDTARDVFQAAAIGRKVIASCLWDDVADTIAGLLLMGVELRVLQRTLRGIVAPRLVRLTCPSCRTGYRPDPAHLGRLGMAPDACTYYRDAGCDRCAEGSRRRMVVYESFSPTPEFWTALGDERSELGIAALIGKHGRVSMREQLAARVAKGYIDPAKAAPILPLTAF